MLEVMLIELGCSHEQFLIVASNGLERDEDKKYYEQLIACDNYLYFKNMMIKRNMQIEEQAYQLMLKQDKKNEFSSDWDKTNKFSQRNEVDCAMAMSLALEEEKKRLHLLEDDDLKVITFLFRKLLSYRKEERSRKRCLYSIRLHYLVILLIIVRNLTNHK
jgi:hypothetical protein